jgi:hypothetical protein
LKILAAQPPDQINPPVTRREVSEIVLNWDLPWNGGSDILHYTIYWQQVDGTTFTSDATVCDGSLAEVISARECTIASVHFTTLPYNLPWGASVYARIEATNVKGTSVVSLTGNGGVIMREPDAPLDL